jgi:two-component system, NarL family, response regulator DesR
VLRSARCPMGRKRRFVRGAIVRVVVADDHRLLLKAVQALLEPEADIEVAGVTHEADRILALVAALEPDLLLLDSHMPGMDGLAFLDRLRAAHPAVAVVLLTESPDPELTTAAFERGAKGVILKSSEPDALASALRAAIRGESPRPVQPATPRVGEALGLTVREEAVVLAMGRGLSNADIARELSITSGTVKFHLHHAYDKLGVGTRLEAFRVLVDRAIFGNDYDWL